MQWLFWFRGRRGRDSNAPVFLLLRRVPYYQIAGVRPKKWFVVESLSVAAVVDGIRRLLLWFTISNALGERHMIFIGGLVVDVMYGFFLGGGCWGL